MEETQDNTAAGEEVKENASTSAVSSSNKGKKGEKKAAPKKEKSVIEKCVELKLIVEDRFEKDEIYHNHLKKYITLEEIHSAPFWWMVKHGVSFVFKLTKSQRHMIGSLTLKEAYEIDALRKSK